jgi:hypothetical protein
MFTRKPHQQKTFLSPARPASIGCYCTACLCPLCQFDIHMQLSATTGTERYWTSRRDFDNPRISTCRLASGHSEAFLPALRSMLKAITSNKRCSSTSVEPPHPGRSPALHPRFTASSRRRPCRSHASAPTDLHARCSRGRDRGTPTGLPSATAREEQEDRGPDAANRPAGSNAALRCHAHDRRRRLNGRDLSPRYDASDDDPHRRGLRTGRGGG